MSDPMAGVSDEAIGLTRDALVIDVYTTSFFSGISALKARGMRQVPGWFADWTRRVSSPPSTGLFDLVSIKEGGLNAFGQSMLDGAARASSIERSDEYRLSVDLAARFGREGPWPEDWGKFAYPPDPYDHYTLQYPNRDGTVNALILYEIVMREVDACDDLILVRKADDLLRARREGRVGVFLDCNCVQLIGDSLEMVSVLYRLGYRQMLMARFSRNLCVDSWVQARTKGGLTPFGEAVVKELNRVGMLIDLSHTNDEGFWDVLEASDAPVICSHSNCRSLCSHPRNLTDEQMRAVAAKGGVIGLMCLFVGPGPEYRELESWPLDDARFQRWLDHFDRAVSVAGIDHVAWGSDGYLTMMGSPAELPKITEGLLRRGYTEADIRKFWGENYLRVFREAVG